MKKLFLLFFPFLMSSVVWVSCSTDEESYKVIGHEHPTEGQDIYPKEESYKNNGRPYVVIEGLGGDHLTFTFRDLEFNGSPVGIKAIRNLSRTAEGIDSLNVIFEPVYVKDDEASLDDNSYYYFWFMLGGDSISHGDNMYLRCSNNGYSYDGLVSLIDDGKGFVEIEMH